MGKIIVSQPMHSDWPADLLTDEERRRLRANEWGVTEEGMPAAPGWYAVINHSSEYVRVVDIGHGRLMAQRSGYPGLYTILLPDRCGGIGQPTLSGTWRRVNDLEEWT